MTTMPREPSLESTYALMRDPYRFISDRCRRLGTDVFEARILLQKSICMRGREAAELFCDETRFTRVGAAPGMLLKTLLGKGGVQGLDGAEHRRRKEMFMSLVTPGRVTDLGNRFAAELRTAADRWSRGGEVKLYKALHEPITRAVCEWAGVPLREEEVSQRTRELTALFDKAGSTGPLHLWSRMARKHADHWAASVIQDIRDGKIRPPAGAAATVVATYRDTNGQPLDPHTAGVELLNVLRPTIAVSVFIVQAVTALHQHPETRERLVASGAQFRDWFVSEVRRFFPFFPAAVSRVRRDFEWKGFEFRAGRRVFLDLYGTNHDPRIWGDPEAFRPERFRDQDLDPFGFVPQGVGGHHEHHRCPGEAIAVEFLNVALDFFIHQLDYETPEQDLGIDFGRLPALPRSRFVMRNVRLAAPVMASAGHA